MRSLVFVAPGEVEIRESPIPLLQNEQILVKTICSAISPGTEMLVYRGQFKRGETEAQDTISSGMDYPLSYGYANVGCVTQIGSSIDKSWLGRTVFAFQPHTSHYVSTPEHVLAVPGGMSPETASFLPFAETAVNLVQDGAPILGEKVLVLGQGVIGLLTAFILSKFPLENLITADGYPLRRQASLEIGEVVRDCLDASSSDFRKQGKSLLYPGADLTLEVSGNPHAINDALALTAYNGRIVIGSWYGEKKAALDFGGTFHRSRIKIISSQVSTIAPELSGRWDKPRRFNLAWGILKEIHAEKWISHRFKLEAAHEAYQLVHENPQATIQLILVYP